MMYLNANVLHRFFCFYVKVVLNSVNGASRHQFTQRKRTQKARSRY